MNTKTPASPVAQEPAHDYAQPIIFAWAEGDDLFNEELTKPEDLYYRLQEFHAAKRDCEAYQGDKQVGLVVLEELGSFRGGWSRWMDVRLVDLMPGEGWRFPKTAEVA